MSISTRARQSGTAGFLARPEWPGPGAVLSPGLRLRAGALRPAGFLLGVRLRAAHRCGGGRRNFRSLRAGLDLADGIRRIAPRGGGRGLAAPEPPGRSGGGRLRGHHRHGLAEQHREAAEPQDHLGAASDADYEAHTILHASHSKAGQSHPRFRKREAIHTHGAHELFATITNPCRICLPPPRFQTNQNRGCVVGSRPSAANSKHNRLLLSDAPCRSVYWALLPWEPPMHLLTPHQSLTSGFLTVCRSAAEIAGTCAGPSLRDGRGAWRGARRGNVTIPRWISLAEGSSTARSPAASALNRGSNVMLICVIAVDKEATVVVTRPIIVLTRVEGPETERRVKIVHPPRVTHRIHL